MGIDVRVEVGVGLGLLAGNSWRNSHLSPAPHSPEAKKAQISRDMMDNGGDALPVGTERDGVSSSRSGGVGLRLATLGVNVDGG
jgi:hypothetical protein